MVIDSHLDSQKLKTLTRGNRLLLSKYNHYGTLARLRGIDIFTKKSSGITINKIESSNNNDMITCSINLPDGTIISTCIVYAPSHKDTPSFWDDALTKLDSSSSPLRLLIGDGNVTIDHIRDSMGYITDPHKKK